MPDREVGMGLNVQEMSLEEFANAYGDNWMVRMLTGVMEGPLTAREVDLAKQFLRKKFLVGLLDEKTETLRRFESYFGWKFPSRVSQKCKNNMFYFEPQSKNIYLPVDASSEAYQVLERRNLYDIELFNYAKQLFEDQASLVDK
mmetsp:Transcript_9048/g.14016  ORF Transcript_9048/g.14016 Transcript_9048/m.14016 type:complete len:144 (+) Transcript_9048:1-432(+)